MIVRLTVSCITNSIWLNTNYIQDDISPLSKRRGDGDETLSVLLCSDGRKPTEAAVFEDIADAQFLVSVDFQLLFQMVFNSSFLFCFLVTESLVFTFCKRLTDE